MIFLCIFMLFSCFFHFTVLYNLHKTAILRFYAFLLSSLCYNESEGKPVNRNELQCAVSASKRCAQNGGSMNIPELSTTLSNIELNNKVGLAVLDKALENSESAGAGLIDMISRSTMELSVNPYVGSNFDMTV